MPTYFGRFTQTVQIYLFSLNVRRPNCITSLATLHTWRRIKIEPADGKIKPVLEGTKHSQPWHNSNKNNKPNQTFYTKERKRDNKMMHWPKARYRVEKNPWKQSMTRRKWWIAKLQIPCPLLARYNDNVKAQKRRRVQKTTFIPSRKERKEDNILKK